MDLPELTQARAPHVTDRFPARRERFLEELERFLAAPGLRIREPQKLCRRPPHAAPGSRGVAQGQALFNTLPIAITDVSGINDDFNVKTVMGTCTTCHDTPHAGNHSVPTPLDIGVADPPVAHAAGGDGVHNRFGLPVADMPVYVLRRKGTVDDLKLVTDPGRALITGKWKDVGRFKGPILRALAGRAPYFHNGSAASLLDVVNFYDARFALGLTPQQKLDLVAFLRTL